MFIDYFVLFVVVLFVVFYPFLYFEALVLRRVHNNTTTTTTTAAATTTNNDNNNDNNDNNSEALVLHRVRVVPEHAEAVEASAHSIILYCIIYYFIYITLYNVMLCYCVIMFKPRRAGGRHYNLRLRRLRIGSVRFTFWEKVRCGSYLRAGGQFIVLL